MSKGSDTYQEILRNKKGIKHSKSKGPALLFIKFLRDQPKGFKHQGGSYVSIIENGFLVRYQKWSNNRMYDITNLDGTLMFINERFERDAPMKPKFGTFQNDAIYKEVIKPYLREKKLLRVLQEFGYEE